MHEEQNGAAAAAPDEAPSLAPDADDPVLRKAEKKRVASTFTPTQLEGARGMTFAPRNFDEVWFLANLFAASGEMVPKIYRERPESAAMAIMWGLELGISPIQAVQGIAVIGGRASVWGDLQHALILTHPEFESIEEKMIDGGDEGAIAICTVKRKGFDAVTRQFSMKDGIRAGLHTKDTYKSYPQRMLPMRARSWAERDAIPHALKGLASADELVDVEARIIQNTERPIESPRAIEDNRERDAVLREMGFPPVVDTPAEELVGDPALSPAERARRATPDLARLFDDLPAAKEEPPVAKSPLSPGQRKLIDTYLEQNFAPTIQEVFDELGDDIHAGNFKRAVDYITNKTAENATANATTD